MLKIRSQYDTHGDCVAVLGYFDGIHAGHKKLICEAAALAKSLSLPLAVFTFSSLPTKDKSERRLLTREERAEVFFSLSVSVIYEIDFDDVKDMDAESFVKEILIRKMRTRVAFCGKSFRFGRGAEYTAEDLKSELERHGAALKTVEETELSGRKISSSEIKKYVEEGEIEKANSLLCEPYFIDSVIVRGRGVGRKLGFPTLNIDIPSEKIILKNGVYKSQVLCEKKSYPALTNVGSCPTFKERKIHAESFIPDFEGDLYGKRVRIYFLEFLRDEKKFESKEALIIQIKEDIERARK